MEKDFVSYDAGIEYFYVQFKRALVSVQFYPVGVIMLMLRSFRCSVKK